MIMSTGRAMRLAGAALVAALAACSAPEPPSPAVPGSTTYKIGAPYRVDGVLYRPSENFDYDETGIASWYGPGFHGETTANGEVYDMSGMTAAHRTLPMPSLVEVTNLDNGRQVRVRINDRGPFARGRIIDVSQRAARLLDFERQGTAKVRVRLLAEESLTLKLRAQGMAPEETVPPLPATAPIAVAATDLPQPVLPPAPRPGASDYGAAANGVAGPGAAGAAAAEGSVVTVAVPAQSLIYVQAGAFSEPGNASRLRDRLAPLGQTRIDTKEVGGRIYYRVRLGPVDTVEAGDRLLASVVQAGIEAARLVVD